MCKLAKDDAHYEEGKFVYKYYIDQDMKKFLRSVMIRYFYYWNFREGDGQTILYTNADNNVILKLYERAYAEKESDKGVLNLTVRETANIAYARIISYAYGGIGWGLLEVKAVLEDGEVRIVPSSQEEIEEIL